MMNVLTVLNVGGFPVLYFPLLTYVSIDVRRYCSRNLGSCYEYASGRVKFKIYTGVKSLHAPDAGTNCARAALASVKLTEIRIKTTHSISLSKAFVVVRNVGQFVFGSFELRARRQVPCYFSGGTREKGK